MIHVLQLTAEFLYLYAPLLLAAAISGIVMRLDWLAFARRPIDAGRSFRGKRLFGDSKTWRGVLVAVVGCMLGAAAQKYLIGELARPVARVDYATLHVVPFAVVMGATAMLGELPNSFVKRQLSIAPGKTTRGWMAVVFYVWDQVDLLIFSLPALSYWARIDGELVVSAFAVTLGLHPLTSLVGYLIGARRTAR